jgi:hypothetical protein
MVRIRFTRALILPAVIASLLVLPAAAQAAAPRDDHRDGGGGISLLGSLFEWVSSVWGAASPTLDPTGQKPTSPPEGAPPEGGVQNPSVGSADQRTADGY